ncbi:MAE_28990/MAE_18760 family HEPN-like nuclease [Nocardiopsis terrae]
MRAVLEGDLAWRMNEVRQLRNLQRNTPGRDSSDPLRRALLVMLYAHFEGYSKFSLEQYVGVINRASLNVSEVKSEIGAACLVERFKRYRSSEPSDPTDPHSSRARQVIKDADFLDQMLRVQGKDVFLDSEQVTSAESNLSPAILRRNLRLLALDESGVHKFTNALNGLLRLRNGIAHGERMNLPSDPSFLKVEERIFGLCDHLTVLIYQAVRDEVFRR